MKFILLLFLLPLTYNAAQEIDTLQTDTTNFHFRPTFAGGQLELTSVLAVTEFGGLVDLDIFQKIAAIHYSFGFRVAFEGYAFFEPGGPTQGGPFRDYCVYFFHSGRGTKVQATILAGLANHTRKDTFYKDEVLPRIGIELRYNLVNTVMALILKGSTSFDSKTGFAGIGIALGFYR